MFLAELFINYSVWHYTLAIRDIFSIWGNFMWFLWNYFSIRQLVRTFFVPYKRLGESAVTIFDFFNYFSAIVITALMRIVGVIVRSIVIAIGLVSIFFTVIFGFIFLIVWLLAPVIFVIAFGVGARLALRPF